MDGGCCCQLQAAGLANLQAGGTGVVGPNPGNVVAGSDYSSGIGTGSSSGVAMLDAGGFVQDVGSVVSNIIGKIQGPQFTRLPNGQIMLPNGQLLGAVPMATGSSNFLIIAAAVILIIVLMTSGK